MSNQHFIGQVVKVTQHTSGTGADLYRSYGKVTELGHSHVAVEFAPGRVYWMQVDMVVDAGSA